MNDVGATVLDLAGIPMPDSIDGITQQPLDGSTFALRPLESDPGTADYDASVRVVHAVHIAFRQRQAVGVDEPLRLQPTSA